MPTVNNNLKSKVGEPESIRLFPIPFFFDFVYYAEGAMEFLIHLLNTNAAISLLC